MPDLSGVGYKTTQAHSQATSQLTTPSPVLPTYMSTEPVYGTQARAAGAIDEGDLDSLAVVIVGVVICCVLGYNIYCIKKKEREEVETNKLTDAQLISHLMLELDRIKASKLDSETALKIAAEKKDRDIQTQLAELRSQIDLVLEKMQEKDAEADISRRQKREAEEALIIEREKAIQLERQATTNALPEANIPESVRGGDNDGELSHRLTGPSMSSPDTATTQVVNGEQSPKATTTPDELNIPNRKRREHWYNYWQARNMTIVHSNDDVIEMELPCFDAKFKNIGIALPAENHEDRM